MGFDLPFRPRITRRRRGPDFFANFRAALTPAMRGEVDFVLHGGDLLYRSKVPAGLVEMAMAPLLEVAGRGVPVYIVPGNHERSRIPLQLWTDHENIHIFDRPRTFQLRQNGTSVALSGFPFVRRAREGFVKTLEATGFRESTADLRLLCLHQVVEGAQVGAADFTFRGGPDVIRGVDIPGEFAAVLCGHIHRAQILRSGLNGHALAAPVIYPGSIERTSVAERHEEKGYYLLTFRDNDSEGGSLCDRDAGGRPLNEESTGETCLRDIGTGVSHFDATFKRLPARPMAKLVLNDVDLNGGSLDRLLDKRLRALDPESVVRVSLNGPVVREAAAALNARRLREITPPTMNVSLSPDTWRDKSARPSHGGAR